MEKMRIEVNRELTGRNIAELMKKYNFTVVDIQKAMGFEYPQAIYGWMKGKSIPKVDNLLVLSRLFHEPIEDIVVIRVIPQEESCGIIDLFPMAKVSEKSA